MKIETREAGDLRPHPLKKQMPRPTSWQKGGDDFNLLLEDIRERGINDPLQVDAHGHILDGVIRWEIAKILHLQCRVLVVEGEPASVILGGLIHRRHLTKSALAYTAFPLFEVARAEMQAKRNEKLRKGQQIPVMPDSGTSGTSRDGFAQKFGVSKDLYDYARRLHEQFTKTPSLRLEWEPKILAGEVALGPALAGIAGAETGGPRKGDQLFLFEAGLDTITKRFEYWQQFDDASRIKARAAIIETVAAMPEDLREAFEIALRQARRKAA